MSIDVHSGIALEHANNLVAWLSSLGEDAWVSYPSSSIEQCSHPDRKSRIVGLLKAANTEVSRCAEFNESWNEKIANNGTSEGIGLIIALRCRALQSACAVWL
jgi:hypothetical protein